MMHFCAITKSNECSLLAWFESLQCPKIVLTIIKKGMFFKSFRGAAPDPARWAYSAPLDPQLVSLGPPHSFLPCDGPDRGERERERERHVQRERERERETERSRHFWNLDARDKVITLAHACTQTYGLDIVQSCLISILTNCLHAISKLSHSASLLKVFVLYHNTHFGIVFLWPSSFAFAGRIEKAYKVLLMFRTIFLVITCEVRKRLHHHLQAFIQWIVHFLCFSV